MFKSGEKEGEKNLLQREIKCEAQLQEMCSAW